jgi:predicted secreted hydrolase
MNLRAVVLGAAAFMAVACGSSATPEAVTTPSPAPTHFPTTAATGAQVAPATVETTPEPLVNFPADEGPHDSAIEWWYFNGLLTDDRGRGYSYHYVTFEGEAAGTAVPHLLQASLGDHTAVEHLTGEQALLDKLDRNATGVDVSVNGWTMRGDGDSYSLRFTLGEYTLVLEAVSTRPPVLHQGTGLVGLGPAGDTFYYTRPRLDVTGSITIGGEQRPVTGTTWMDHQWGDVVGRRVGWDWVSLQLDDGSDLMAMMVWDPLDRAPFGRHGTLVSPDGSVLTLEDDDVSISSSDTWTSPVTGIEYPSGWTVVVHSLDLSLELEPVLLDSEFSGSRFNPAAYWEGEVRVKGTLQGRSVGGRGFVELVGYDPSQLEPTPAP